MKDVEKYFEALPEHRRARLEKIQARVAKLIPGVDVSMKFKMPTYETANGWLALASQKNYISIYTCGAHHLEKFRAKHPKVKGGKGCLNFRDNDDIPFADLDSVIRSALMRGGH